MAKLLLKHCNALVVELALEVIVAQHKIPMAKVLLEACNAQKVARILVIATTRGRAKVVELIQAGRN